MGTRLNHDVSMDCLSNNYNILCGRLGPYHAHLLLSKATMDIVMKLDDYGSCNGLYDWRLWMVMCNKAQFDVSYDL